MLKHIEVSPDKEKLQKPYPADSSFEMVETSLFIFYVPEEKIYGQIYHFTHPILGVASGGISVFQGNIATAREADCFSWRIYQPMPEDISDATYPDGTSTKMIKPLEKFELKYHDENADNHLDLTVTAIMPPAGAPAGTHFMQFAKNEGTLVLRGKKYNVDCVAMRDRGWSMSRGEGSRSGMPKDFFGIFHTPVFGEDLAFSMMGMDGEFLDEDQHPYPNFAWAGGEIRAIKSRRQKTVRDPSSGGPASIELEVIDERDVRYLLKGETVACSPYPYFQPNTEAFMGLANWTCELSTGEVRKGYGDLQLWT